MAARIVSEGEKLMYRPAKVQLNYGNGGFAELLQAQRAAYDIHTKRRTMITLIFAAFIQKLRIDLAIVSSIELEEGARSCYGKPYTVKSAQTLGRTRPNTRSSNQVTRPNCTVLLLVQVYRRRPGRPRSISVSPCDI